MSPLPLCSELLVLALIGAAASGCKLLKWLYNSPCLWRTLGLSLSFVSTRRSPLCSLWQRRPGSFARESISWHAGQEQRYLLFPATSSQSSLLSPFHVYSVGVAAALCRSRRTRWNWQLWSMIGWAFIAKRVGGRDVTIPKYRFVSVYDHPMQTLLDV